MRAAHMQALDRLDCGKTPSQLKRFAEQVRTHLFDLSRIGERMNTDIVDRLLAKLSTQDRLAWYESNTRNGGSPDLSKFGHWLCERAAAYQSAYDLAAEQSGRRTESSGKQAWRSLARTNATTASKATPDHVRGLQCDNCEGQHTLWSCEGFRSMEPRLRWRLVSRKRLCFSCLQG